MKNISPFIFLIVFFIACSNEANIERDKDFIEKELEPFAITQRKKYLETDYQEPWMKTSGLMDLFKKKGLR